MIQTEKSLTQVESRKNKTIRGQEARGWGGSGCNRRQNEMEKGKWECERGRREIEK